MNKKINLNHLVEQLLELSLEYISIENEDSYLYFDELHGWCVKPKYEDLRFSLKKAFSSELEELGFKHKTNEIHDTI